MYKKNARKVADYAVPKFIWNSILNCMQYYIKLLSIHLHIICVLIIFQNAHRPLIALPTMFVKTGIAVEVIYK